MSKLKEFVGVPPQADSMTLDYLNSVMNKSGIDDQAIIAGAEFTHQGYIKLANIMSQKMGKHIAVKDVQMIINELMERLRTEHHQMAEAYEEVLDEDGGRFSYEADFLGNVTVRDNDTGNEVYIQGSEASSLMSALGSGLADEQSVLGQYMSEPVNEDFDPEETDVQSYEPEIESKRGTYNFPWKSDKAHGTATAEYSGKGNIRVVSIRDSEGNPVKATPDLNADLHRQAVEFIGDA